MASWHRIDEYKAAVAAGPGGPAANITLLAEGAIVGMCSFWREGDLPPNAFRTTVELSYPLSSYSAVIDLLRNEEPVFLWYDADRASGMVTTLPEPVGEGEVSGRSSDD